MPIDTGGVVRPFMGSPEKGVNGETLLDWFAGQAMTGDLANGGFIEDNELGKSVAQRSYEFAIAMIAEKRRLEALP